MNAAKAWFLASRPKTLVAGLSPVLLTHFYAKAAGYQPQLKYFWSALFATLFIQITSNLVNDAADFEKGADTHERLGPKRATQQGWLTAKTIKFAAFLCTLLAFTFAIPLFLKGGLVILVLGLASALAAYLYTSGPWPLAYLGLGEIFVFIFFGIVACSGLSFIYTGSFIAESLILGSQVGLLAVNLIFINNLRDIHQDVAVKKLTLATRLGENRSKQLFWILIFLPFLIHFYWIQKYPTEVLLFLPILSLLILSGIATQISQTSPSQKYNSFLAKAGASQLLFSLLLSLAFYFISERTYENLGS